MNISLYRGGVVARHREEPDGQWCVFIVPDEGVMSSFSLDMVVAPEATQGLRVGRRVVVSVEALGP